MKLKGCYLWSFANQGEKAVSGRMLRDDRLSKCNGMNVGLYLFKLPKSYGEHPFPPRAHPSEIKRAWTVPVSSTLPDLVFQPRSYSPHETLEMDAEASRCVNQRPM